MTTTPDEHPDLDDLPTADPGHEPGVETRPEDDRDAVDRAEAIDEPDETAS